MPRATKTKSEPEPGAEVKRIGISIPVPLYESSMAKRVNIIRRTFPEYNLSDYIRDLLRKDQGLPTSPWF